MISQQAATSLTATQLSDVAEIKRMLAVKPDIDYLAKDFASFRQLMLNHLSVLVPDWREQSPADLGNVLLDLLAYAADYASYQQDGVATEAYLGTARLRRSVKRHARLLDYAMHEGANARVWVQLTVSDHCTLPAKSLLLTKVPGFAKVLAREDSKVKDLLAHNPQVFETMHASQLRPAHNTINFYLESPADVWLRQGATSAKLLARDTQCRTDQIRLSKGDVLIFEEVRDPAPGKQIRLNPRHRHAVRLSEVETSYSATVPHLTIKWAVADALPFDLYLGPFSPGDIKSMARNAVTVARGNVVLADHGRWIRDEVLPPVPPEGRYRPTLRLPGLTFRAAYNHDNAQQQPATETLQQDPQWAKPIVQVYEEIPLPKMAGRALLPLRYHRASPIATVPRASNNTSRPTQDMQIAWNLRTDLLNSNPFGRDFMVEMEDDRRAYLRFGMLGMGREPAAGAYFTAEYRIGNGTSGNIGQDALYHLVTDGALAPNIDAVRNPLPALGGTDPERLDEVRLYAPQAFQSVVERCITPDDFAVVAQRFPDVAQVAIEVRRVGIWNTVLLLVQRQGGRTVDALFRRKMAAYMAQYCPVGYEIEVCPPNLVPIAITLQIAYAPGTSLVALQAALQDRFGTTLRTDGQPGFFHPTRLRFGQSLHRSQIVAAAMRVAGVTDVHVEEFNRIDAADDAPKDGPPTIYIGPLEIAKLADDEPISFNFD